jgi:hypothetical protein
MPFSLPVLMRSRHLFVLTLPMALCLGSTAYAQQPQAPADFIRISPEDAGRGLNGVQKNFSFALGNSLDYQNAGFFGQRLRPYVQPNSEALASLNRYRRQKWLFLTERLVFVGALGVYSQQVLAGDEQQYFNNPQKAALGVAVGSLLANALISRHTNQHFLRSVETHNATLHSARRIGMERVKPSLLGVTAVMGRPQLLLGWTLR